MRLYKYLSVSCSEDASVFRSLGLHLVEESTGKTEVIAKLQEEGVLDEEVLMLLDRANRELKKMYRGKLKFDLCLEDEGLTPDDLKIEEKKAKAIKEKWFKFNDELSKIQIKFENNLKKSLHN